MAIALDVANAGATGTGTSLTFSHTCTGSNLILFVGFSVLTQNTDDITGVTYAGVAMTQVGKVKTPDADNRWVYLYYLAGPATGANNVVISSTSSTQKTANAVSYTGAKQTGIPDASATNTTDNGTTLTGTVTTIADNSWLVAALRVGGGNIAAGTGTTLRGTISSFNKMADSNGATTPAGSDSLTVTYDSQDAAIVIASFAPATGSSASSSISSSISSSASSSISSSVSPSSSISSSISSSPSPSISSSISSSPSPSISSSISSSASTSVSSSPSSSVSPSSSISSSPSPSISASPSPENRIGTATFVNRFYYNQGPFKHKLNRPSQVRAKYH